MSMNIPKAAAEYSKNSNSNLQFHKSSAGHLSVAEPQRRRRRKKSRVINRSRSISLMLAEQGASFSDLSRTIIETQKAELPKKQGYDDLSTIVIDDYIKDRKFSSSVSASVPRRSSNEVEEKRGSDRSRGTILLNSKPLPDHMMKPTSGRPSDASINLNWSEQIRRRADGSNFSDNVPRSEFDILEASSYYDLDCKLDFSQDGMDFVVTDADDETLPPYFQIVPQMFYRFAGISEYSDSTTMQSRGDFEKLLKCLDLDTLLEEFLVWFPKPKLAKPGCGYISLDMFCELFKCKFAQTILEARWQYETLCSAILTMKCLDKHKVNRIEFVQFLHLYRSLYGNDVQDKDVRTVFEKYDTDGIGQLHIVNIFKFCSDEEDDGE